MALPVIGAIGDAIGSLKLGETFGNIGYGKRAAADSQAMTTQAILQMKAEREKRNTIIAVVSVIGFLLLAGLIIFISVKRRRS